MQVAEESTHEAPGPRPSLARIAFRWVKVVAASFAIGAVVSWLMNLVWVPDEPFTWRDSLSFALTFGTGLFAAFLAVDLRYDRRALEEPGHPMYRKANLLFFVVLATIAFALAVLEGWVLS